MCDFRAIWRLSWWGSVERGDIDEVEILIHGLMMRPDSLYRATTYSTTPPALSGDSSGHLGWHGWDQQTSLLLGIHNLLAGPKGRLSGPETSQVAPMTLTEIEVLQQLRLR